MAAGVRLGGSVSLPSDGCALNFALPERRFKDLAAAALHDPSFSASVGSEGGLHGQVETSGIVYKVT